MIGLDGSTKAISSNSCDRLGSRTVLIFRNSPFRASQQQYPGPLDARRLKLAFHYDTFSSIYVIVCSLAHQLPAPSRPAGWLCTPLSAFGISFGCQSGRDAAGLATHVPRLSSISFWRFGSLPGVRVVALRFEHSSLRYPHPVPTMEHPFVRESRQHGCAGMLDQIVRKGLHWIPIGGGCASCKAAVMDMK